MYADGIAMQRVSLGALIIALGMLEMEPIAGVDFIQGDFREDEVLEQTYMTRWQSNLNTIWKAIMEPPHGRPLILNGGLVGGTPYSGVSWDLPAS